MPRIIQQYINNETEEVVYTLYDTGQIILPNGLSLTQGNGSPEGVVTAVVGSIYFCLDGVGGFAFYIKNTGTGNTGWSGVGASAGAVIQAFSRGPFTLSAGNSTTIDIAFPTPYDNDNWMVTLGIRADFSQNGLITLGTLQTHGDGTGFFLAAFNHDTEDRAVNIMVMAAAGEASPPPV